MPGFAGKPSAAEVVRQCQGDGVLDT